MKEITQRELRNDSGAVMRQLINGEQFLVTRNGDPIGQLQPLRRQFASSALLVDRLAHLGSIDGAKLRREHDGVIDQRI